jgi:hypothetical protein
MIPQWLRVKTPCLGGVGAQSQAIKKRQRNPQEQDVALPVTSGGASLLSGFPRGKRACFDLGWPTCAAGFGGIELELDAASTG